MDSSTTIGPYLFLLTFIVAIGIGLWLYRRARIARAEHHSSADARVHGDKPGPIGGKPRQPNTSG